MPTYKSDDHVVPAQLICFLLSFLFLLQTLLIHGTATPVLMRMKDTFFITGTTLLSIKLTRDGWEMPAAGFIILAIGWGVLFAATDLLEEKTGFYNLASAFYFVLPAMVLMTFFKPFPVWLKILLIMNIIPFLVSVAIKIANPKSVHIIYWSVINILFMHIVSLIWSIYFFVQHRKQRK